METTVLWWLPAGVAFVGILIGYLAHMILARAHAQGAKTNARDILQQARHAADSTAREAEILAREAIIKAREAFEQERLTRRQELRTLEERLTQRETNLDRRVALVDKKEITTETRSGELETQRQALLAAEALARQGLDDARTKLQQVAALPQEEARRLVRQQAEEDLRGEMSQLLHRRQQQVRATAEAEAREIITGAIERYAAAQVNEVTTCTVTLLSDDMKGRIIGREGRNIRTLEAATGVNILIDDTPGVVQVSAFDPVRREIARQVLERLMADGRIQPARIEETVAEVREELNELMRQAGEQALSDLGLQGVVPELAQTLGRLKFRQSYSQNVLTHSVETATLMGLMAAELGLDPAIARRVGLFHDIGKALDHHVEGNHAIIGADLLKQHDEPAVVYNAVAAHHHDVGGTSLYAALASAADAITAARPGARAENTEIYLKRLKALEDLAARHHGVERAYALEAGREIRVFVKADQVDDALALQLARTLSQQIEQELKFPGQIKVVVVRETRYIEYAR
ncbi:MAG: ribonuclease Y [Kiritimatiellaeota bacterium]|nr:ribonuclease Y [Kiritimatiellota bacterium]